jgi:hypothetical protein
MTLAHFFHPQPAFSIFESGLSKLMFFTPLQWSLYIERYPRFLLSFYFAHSPLPPSAVIAGISKGLVA